MDLETAVVIGGGQVSGEADLHESFSAVEFEVVTGWLARAQELMDAFCEEVESQPVAAVLTRSPSLVLRIRPLDDGSVVLLVPMGLIVRTRLLAALLLPYADREHTTRFVASVLDDRPESDWELPNRLHPLFGEYADHAQHWELLSGIVADLAPGRELSGELQEVMWSVLNYGVMHEVAHVLRSHPAAASRFQRAGREEVLAITEREFRRGLELDADTLGAQLFLATTEMELEDVLPENRNAAFESIGFAVTLLLGMYDTRRKALGLYSTGLYPHPVVRHKLFVRASHDYVAGQRPDWLDDWNRNETAGWTRCVKAFWRLDEECFVGKFSDPPQQGARTVPVTALNYNAFDMSFTDSQLEREMGLRDSVLSILDGWSQT